MEVCITTSGLQLYVLFCSESMELALPLQQYNGQIQSVHQIAVLQQESRLFYDGKGMDFLGFPFCLGYFLYQNLDKHAAFGMEVLTADVRAVNRATKILHSGLMSCMMNFVAVAKQR